MTAGDKGTFSLLASGDGCPIGMYVARTVDPLRRAEMILWTTEMFSGKTESLFSESYETLVQLGQRLLPVEVR